MSELLPCPFCGGEAEVTGYRSCDCCGKAYNGAVGCTICEAEVSHLDTDGEAIAKWNARAAMPQGEPVAWHEPTPAQIASACMSYRHDFGLLDATAQQTMKWQASEWFRAWQKEFEASPSLPVSEPSGWQPIGLRYLEDLAKDCEECAADACNDGDKGLQRSWLSVAYRIRHAVKALAPAPEAQP